MKIETATTVVLTLTEKEAKWLHDNLQNPLHTQTPFDESAEDEEMRIKFFEATHTRNREGG